jgi:hypothetical protein
MTWLTGQTQWSLFKDKIVSLACGESADDQGVTLVAADRWVRKLAGQDLICPPLTTAIDHDSQVWRSGYVTQHLPGTVNNQNTSIRQKTLFTSLPYPKTLWKFSIQDGNQTQGVYNTTQPGRSVPSMYILGVDLDNRASVAAYNPSINAAGEFTVLGATFQVTSLTGFIDRYSLQPPNQPFFTWTRAATTEFMGGIDYIPRLNLRHPSSTVTFPTAPGGVEGTDWAVVEKGTADSGHDNSYGQTVGVSTGGRVIGVGQKTVAGLTGAIYSISFKMMKTSFWPYVSTAGIISARWNCGAAPDSVTPATIRRMGGYDHGSWLRAFELSGNVLSTSLVQYWMSITKDKIVVVANGDPGQSGRLGAAAVINMTPRYPGIDLLTYIYTPQPQQYLTDNSAETPFGMFSFMPVTAQRALLTGTLVKDHGAQWMRGDIAYNDTATAAVQVFQAGGKTGFSQGTRDGYPNFETKPFPEDSKWWLYGWHYTDSVIRFDDAAVDDNKHPRGYQDALCYIPSSGWASGDELLDTGVTPSKAYFLVAPDYGTGVFARVRYTSNAYAGGCAIRED